MHQHLQNSRYQCYVGLIALLFLPLFCNAQETDHKLKQLLKIATDNYPLLKAKQLQAAAAERGESASKRSLVPSLDAAYQLNHATYNNITGMAYPQYLIPISGPPSVSNSYKGVFGTAASLLMSWQPITFGKRQAEVDYARSSTHYAYADADYEVFQHKVNVIAAYIGLLSTQELVAVNKENIQRISAYLKNVQTLVNSGIRPGVDTALMGAELSKAKVEELNSRRQYEKYRTLLERLVVSDGEMSLQDTLFFSKLPKTAMRKALDRHPALQLMNAGIQQNKEKKKLLSRSVTPTLGVWATGYARGSGIAYDGTVHHADGFGFQRYNYGLGLQLSIPILQSVRIKPQVQQQDLLLKAAEQERSEKQLQLQKEDQLADTTLSQAIAIAHESPKFLRSAAFSYQAMRSRYESGLANFADLMQAQYALVKAQTDFRLAYAEAWNALLYKASINGDLQLFLDQLN